MYERVLIPLDGSELAEAILPFAEHVAGPLDAEVVLLQVVEPPSAISALGTGGIIGPDTLYLRQVEAKRYLDTVAGRLQAKGLRVRTVLGPRDAGIRDRRDRQGRTGRSDCHDHARAERVQAGDLRLGGGGGLAEPPPSPCSRSGTPRPSRRRRRPRDDDPAPDRLLGVRRVRRAAGREDGSRPWAASSSCSTWGSRRRSFGEGLMTAKEVREVFDAARKWATGALEARVAKIREHGLDDTLAAPDRGSTRGDRPCGDRRAGGLRRHGYARTGRTRAHPSRECRRPRRAHRALPGRHRPAAGAVTHPCLENALMPVLVGP